MSSLDTVTFLFGFTTGDDDRLSLATCYLEAGRV